MFSTDAIRAILGIEESVQLTPLEMADKLNITFYPYSEHDVSPHVLAFATLLEKTLFELKANIVPYEESLEHVSVRKRIRRVVRILINDIGYFFQRIIKKTPSIPFIGIAVIKSALRPKRIKAGISVIALGEQATGNLPMDNTSSFRRSSVITILDRPDNIKKETAFQEHFDTAMHLFAYHMTNIVLAVDEKEWIVYNFNASHPVYQIDDTFKEHVLSALIPKIVAPIRPYRFSEFIVTQNGFDPHDEYHERLVYDLTYSGTLLEKTGLYPPGKKIEDLPFRNKFYEWIGKIHLDNRNGMSYGFLALQMPVQISPVMNHEEAEKFFGDSIPLAEGNFVFDTHMYFTFSFDGELLYMKIPDVWVLSQRSGCDKTHMDPEKDILKMGLIDGQMHLRSPKGLELTKEYKPSFDTKVILAHAVGNAIVASLSAYKGINSHFVTMMRTQGVALAHWHGYINPNMIPEGWFTHGIQNPHVACSSPQSAVYALSGKLDVFIEAFAKKKEYRGDIHIEPHHGTNIIFPSLVELGKYLSGDMQVAVLGNAYLYLYEHNENL
ncbi:MAG: hypothetical protein HGB03_01135 [Candidatus Yonathbacteria bacterium]|nr:hypothetical protein [Candidatus Yonathbacteria bacterium]NTW47868.1 hypothetical protein [Candidatus Yonathbacteria bacterium]